MIQKWNKKLHKYEPYQPKEDGVYKVYSENMDEIINCVNCGKKIKFGDGYTSHIYHTPMGIGYIVCEECHQNE